VSVTGQLRKPPPEDAVELDLLGLTAAGLVSYGLYCLVDARYRDVSI